MTNEKNNLIYSEAGEGQGYTTTEIMMKEAGWEDEKKMDRELQYFENKRAKYNFESSWCLTHIRAFVYPSPFKGKWMTNGVNNDIRVELPNKHLTGKELWQYADELYKKLGDIDHRFIEEFTENGDTIEVFFGS